MTYKNILHIDDDEDDLEFFSTAIEELDSMLQCTSMHSPREALKKLTAKELNPDIIFIDLNMPLMDGFQFLSELKKLPGFAIPVVTLSTSSQFITRQQVDAIGAAGYITKPTSIREFKRLISAFLE